MDLVSQASPILFHSAAISIEEGSGDLGPLYMNSWNTLVG